MRRLLSSLAAKRARLPLGRMRDKVAKDGHPSGIMGTIFIVNDDDMLVGTFGSGFIRQQAPEIFSQKRFCRQSRPNCAMDCRFRAHALGRDPRPFWSAGVRKDNSYLVCSNSNGWLPLAPAAIARFRPMAWWGDPEDLAWNMVAEAAGEGRERPPSALIICFEYCDHDVCDLGFQRA